ncbi:MAG TPA: DUF421 domain-containing protein [Bacillaceae bacterium]
MMDLPEWLDIVFRSIIMVIVLFLLTKWLGKKQLSQLSFFEYVAGITVGSIAAEISTGLDRNVLHGIFSLIVWMSIPFFAGLIGVKHKKIRDFIEGTYTVVVKDGKILEENLAKEKYSVDELMHLLRKKNAFHIADVEFAVLEANGDLNVLLKKEKQPLTPKDLQLNTNKETAPHTVILEGKIIDSELAASGLSRTRLKAELHAKGAGLENIYIGQVNSNGKLAIDLYDDQLQVPESNEKKILLSMLKKCHADVELFSFTAESEAERDRFKMHAEKLERMIKKTEPLLH